MHTLFGAGVGFLIGVFCPAVARTVKSWFSKTASAAASDVAKKL